MNFGRCNMQTETITQVKKFKLEFEKFVDYVYIKCSDSKHLYLLPRKYFDEMEAKHSKGKVPYNWLLNLQGKDKYLAMSPDYLKQYFETGRWAPADYNTWIIDDPLPLLRAGQQHCYYQAWNVLNGFLHFEGKRVLRPFHLILRGYSCKDIIVKKLRKNPKVLKAEIGNDPYSDCCGCDESSRVIRVIYKPSVREFNRLVAEDKADSSSAEYDIIRRLGIKQYQIR